MTSIPAPPVPLSQVGRAAHDLGLAGLLGGNLFGRLALHPSVTEISDKTERGKVVNAAWRRYGAINSLSLLAVAAGWAGARAAEARPRRLSQAERRLAVAKDVLVGVVAVTGLATAAQGIRFARQAPGRRRAARRRRPRRGRGDRGAAQRQAAVERAGPRLARGRGRPGRRERRARAGGLPAAAAPPSDAVPALASRRYARCGLWCGAVLYGGIEGRRVPVGAGRGWARSARARARGDWARANDGYGRGSVPVLAPGPMVALTAGNVARRAAEWSV